MSTVTLGELCDFINGGAWSDSEYCDAGIPVLKVSNCQNGGFSLSEVSYLSPDLRGKYKRNMLRIDDVIIATVGSHPQMVESAAGRSCIVTCEVAGYYLNQNAVCVRTVDPRVLNQRYLFYLSKTKKFMHYIQNCGKGAASQMRIAIGAIKDYAFDLPDIDEQARVVAILSAYDDLIENNRRQIKLLEEAAQRLYREWFVELRFPGHEDVKIVDGVPEGWNMDRITSFYSIRYGRNLPLSQILKSGLYPVYGANGIIGYYNQKNVDCSVALITSRGNGSGNVSRTYAKEAFITNNSFWAIPLLQNEELPFCHQLLLHTDFKKVCSGSAQPQLTYAAIEAIMVLHPEEKLVRNFCTLVNPIYMKIDVLFQQISLLEMARDRLLPKLMSGEMGV